MTEHAELVRLPLDLLLEIDARTQGDTAEEHDTFVEALLRIGLARLDLLAARAEEMRAA